MAVCKESLHAQPQKNRTCAKFAHTEFEGNEMFSTSDISRDISSAFYGKTVRFPRVPGFPDITEPGYDGELLDALNLRSDWEAVGNDIRKAIETEKKRIPVSPPS